MSLFLKINLATHVILGIIGIIFFYVVWLNLLKQKINLKILRFASFSGLVAFLTSWLTGGYYYYAYYSPVVRSIIKNGRYSWAHTIFTESKEHIFFFLPFLAIVSFSVFWLIGEKIEGNNKLKHNLILINGLITIIGIFIAVAGMLISGAVRQ